MAKWVLPEGRKPLPDEWFAERAQMQERIKELEAKLAKAVDALKFYAEASWSDLDDDIGFDANWQSNEPGELARATIAELKG